MAMCGNAQTGALPSGITTLADLINKFQYIGSGEQPPLCAVCCFPETTKKQAPLMSGLTAPNPFKQQPLVWLIGVRRLRHDRTEAQWPWSRIDGVAMDGFLETAKSGE